jgi:hypothetical protein
MSKSDDEPVPTVLETVCTLLKLGEIVDVQEMRSWGEDDWKIKIATDYLREQFKLGLVVRIRWPRERYVAAHAVKRWVASGCLVPIGNDLFEPNRN